MEEQFVAQQEVVSGVSPKHPVSLVIEYPEQSSRLLAASALFFMVKALLLIPSAFVLYFISLLAFVLLVCNYFVVLFTGKQNRAIFDFLTGYLRWSIRLNAYFMGLTDTYPPFRLEE